MKHTCRLPAWALLLVALMALAACQPESSSVPPGGIATPSPAPLTPRPTALAALPTPAPSQAAPNGASDYVVWVGDDFPLDSASGQALWNVRNAYQNANPSVRITLLQKKSEGGKGGIEDLLTTAQAAAPQALPDIITLDLRDLPRYVRNGMAQPLDAQSAPSLQSDLYSFARAAAQIDNRIYAVPFTADFLHLVYDSAQFKTPPLTWTELISSGARYAFAAGGDNGAVSGAFLAQYAALGGRFVDARGRPALDRAPFIDALEFFRVALAKGATVTNTLSLRSEDDALKLFAAGRVPLADASARAYLRDRATLRGAGFSPVPTRDGNLSTIAHAWGFAVVARDANRRIVAQRFVESLVSTDANAAWNRAAGRLPVRRTALPGWTSDPLYRDFANQMLSVAVNPPATAAGGSLDVVMQVAVADVLANGLSPAEAADKAIAALNR